MIPFGKYTVTLVSRTDVLQNGNKSTCVYKGVYLYRCSWKAVRMANNVEKAHSVKPVVTCRIPINGNTMPEVGDVLFLGIVDTKNITDSISLQNAMDKHGKSNCFRVSSVSNNAMEGFPIKHYCARGEA